MGVGGLDRQRVAGQTKREMARGCCILMISLDGEGKGRECRILVVPKT